jgi:hypothetical protein
MKKHILLFSMLLTAALFFTACNKEETTPVIQESATSEDLVTFQKIIQDTEEEVDEQIGTSGGGGGNGCAIITVEPDDGTFPKTITLDYGDGCEGPHGHVRKGVISINLTDNMLNDGAVRTVTFVDFFVDEVQVQGTKTLTNLGLNDDEQLVMTRTVEDASLSFPNDTEVQWEASQEVTKIEGGATNELIDDVYEIKGSSSGINRMGKDFVSEIVDPLIKARNCRWVVSGVRTVTVEDQMRTIDYGDGECDRKAEVTGPNGNTFTVLIRRWW